MKYSIGRVIKTIAVIGTVFLIWDNAALAENRLIRPAGVYYHRFASMVGGAEGIWTNPAALGQGGPIRFQFIGEYADDELAKNWGGAVSGDRIGIGYRRLDDYNGGQYEEYIFGAGSGLGHYSFLGGSYTYVSKAEGPFNKKHFWNLGFMLISSPRMKLGGVLSNLNRSHVDGEKSDIEQLYSISYRPQKLPVWISVEMSLSTGQSLSSADFTYGLESSPVEHLQAYASYRTGGFIEIGLSYFWGEYYGGAQTRLNKNPDHLGTSLYGGYLFSPSGKK